MDPHTPHRTDGNAVESSDRAPILDRGTFTYSIVIPVYNSVDVAGRTVDRVVEVFESAGLSFELILVNDGSRDGSWDVIAERARAHPRVTALDLLHNYGQHQANLAGFREATGDYVITMDDDLQNPISEVVRLLEHARAGGWDVVYTYYAEKKHAAWRNLGSRFANKVADVLLDKPRGLYLSSFRCSAKRLIPSSEAARLLLPPAARRAASIERFSRSATAERMSTLGSMGPPPLPTRKLRRSSTEGERCSKRTSPCDSTTMRRISFSSSRTLPGQS